MSIKHDILVVGGIVVLFTTLYFLFYYYPEKELKYDYRYTIGLITKIETPDNGDNTARYYYRIKGRTYWNFFILIPKYAGKYPVDSRIFVKYARKSPEYSIMIDYTTVPDTLKAPENGWKVLPKF